MEGWQFAPMAQIDGVVVRMGVESKCNIAICKRRLVIPFVFLFFKPPSAFG
jgi:hypothetical protein